MEDVTEIKNLISYLILIRRMTTAMTAEVKPLLGCPPLPTSIEPHIYLLELEKLQ